MSEPDLRGAAGIVQICQTMWQIEQEFRLVERRIADVPYWPLVRQQIFARLKSKMAAAREHSGSAPSRSLLQHAARRAGPAISSLFAPRHRAADGYNTILIPFPRRRTQNGVSVDPLSERILSDEGLGRILVLDTAPASTRYRSSPSRTVVDFGRIESAIYASALAWAPALLPAAAAEHGLVDAAIRRHFGFACPVSALRFAIRASVFAQGRHLSRRLFAKSGAKSFLFVGPYWRLGVTAAAADAGIRDAEIQHGAMSPYHLAHHYPGRPSVPAMASKVLTFGPFWERNVELPRNTKAVVIGRAGGAHSSHAAGRRRVVIPSHMPTDHRLFDIAVEVAGKLRDWEFVFRPHPDEDAERYRGRANMPANLHLSLAREDLGSLLEGAQFQMGVCSTVLFEGLSAGLRTIIVALSGHEIMERVIAEGDARLALSADDVAALLPDAPAVRDRHSYFSEPSVSISGAIGAQ